MKYFFSLLSIARKIFGYRLFLFGIATGMANAALISIINESIRHGIEKKTQSVILFFFYVIALVIYFSLQYFFQALLIRSAEKLILKSRTELIGKIRESSLRSYEQVGSNKLFVLLAQDTNTIGQIASLSSNVIIAMVVITGSLIYLSVLSFTGFVLTIFIISVSLFIAFAKQKTNIRRIRHVIELENIFLGYMRNMLLGIKEIKMDSKINEGLYNRHVKPYMEQVSKEKTSNSIFQSRFGLLGQLIFFLTMGFILYLFPILEITITKNPAQFVIVLLYILAPIQTLIPLIPQFSQIKITMERIESVKKTLEPEQPLTEKHNKEYDDFKTISVKNLMYSYRSGRDNFDFSLGPIDIEIRAGEIIFIHGENGSGKSTLIKVLAGLYAANKGTISLDKNLITPYNIQHYRNLFGIIFTDNHLFEYIYDTDNVSEISLNELITKVGLNDKVKFEDNKFSTIDLSEGQKKRIALISLLLKDKPIYVFDEWAANQDPDFRNFFYTELIPELSSLHKTIIIITHDERYLRIANRVLKMENGLLHELSQPVTSTQP
jgi:putative ATP-binding cassette transporter